jgi:hypothetical protein
MTFEKLRELYDVEPFQPFSLRLADGREIPVKHREFMASAPASRIVAVFQPDGRMNLVDLELVTDVELRPTKPARRKPNGGSV